MCTTNQFCETSCKKWEFAAPKQWNSVRVRQPPQHPKRSNSASLPSKNRKVERKADSLCDFSTRCVRSIELATKKVKPSHTKCCIVLHLSGKIILANRKIWCGQMQPLSGNQRQDRRTCLTHASLVIAPATRHASLPTLWKRPTPAIALQLQYKTDVWTSKSVRTCGVFGFFLHVDFESRFVPQQCALFRHLNFQKCSENDVF